MSRFGRKSTATHAQRHTYGGTGTAKKRSSTSTIRHHQERAVIMGALSHPNHPNNSDHPTGSRAGTPAVPDDDVENTAEDAAMWQEYHPTAIAVLKGFIVLFELICLWGQYVIYVMAGDVVALYPETAPARWPYTIAGILGVACFEVALIPLWRLLDLVKRRDVFSGKAVWWTNAIIVCAAAEGALVLFVLLFGLFADFQYCDPTSGDCFNASMTMPAVGLACLVALLLIAAFILLMLVMRSLLSAAIAQRSELEAVI